MPEKQKQGLLDLNLEAVSTSAAPEVPAAAKALDPVVKFLVYGPDYEGRWSDEQQRDLLENKLTVMRPEETVDAA